MTTTTSSKTYANVTKGDLSFTNIVANETDVLNGSSFVHWFTGNSSDPTAITSGLETGMSWSGLTMTTASDGTGATQTVTITYNAAETGSNFIAAIDSLYNFDIASLGSTFVATESIASASNPSIPLATQTYTYGTAAPAPAPLTMGVQNAVVTLTMTESAAAAGVEVSASVVDQLFAETPSTALTALGDYVWMDTNRNGIQDGGETGVAGVTVDLLNSTGTSVLSVTTTNASGLYHFTGLLPGAYEVKFVAPIGEFFTLQSQGTNTNLDPNPNPLTGITSPVTLTAGQTNNSIDAGLTLQVQVAPAVTLDKEISTDGTTWLDAGVGNLAQDPSVFVGSAIYERVIVSNTGSVALTGLTVADVGGNGPASFAVGPQSGDWGERDLDRGDDQRGRGLSTGYRDGDRRRQLSDRHRVGSGELHGDHNVDGGDRRLCLVRL
jgi:hypothetical protein